MIKPVTLANIDDKANCHTREEQQLRLTDSSTSSTCTITIENDKLHALTSRRSQIDT